MMKQKLFPLLLAFLLLTGCSAHEGAQPSAAGESASLNGAVPQAEGREEAAPTERAETDAEVHDSTIFAMDTVMDLRLYGPEELLRGAEEIIYTLEDSLSVTDEGSEIYAVNRDGGGTLSPHTAELLRAALALCERSGGALDISIYPVVRAWGFTTEAYRVPSREELDALLEAVDYRRIDLNGTDAVSLPAGMQIDLGSVAKGYASGKVLDYWRANGVTSALLNLGGNVHALGAKPDGSLWRVGVADPLGGSYLGVLEIADRAVITSGGYERCFVEDGETYWHILDPATGAPAKSGLISVTIVGGEGVVCDGFSTALFVLGLEKAADLWRESDDFEAVLVTEDGALYITEGLEGHFTAAGDYADTEVQVIRRG